MPLGELSAERRITGGIECYRVPRFIGAAMSRTFKITSPTEMAQEHSRLLIALEFAFKPQSNVLPPEGGTPNE